MYWLLKITYMICWGASAVQVIEDHYLSALLGLLTLVFIHWYLKRQRTHEGHGI